MPNHTPPAPQSYSLPRRELQRLLDLLQQQGFDVIGPRVRDDAIVYSPLGSIDELPQGVSDRQSPGAYRLQQNSTSRAFAWANGPQALKPLLFSPQEVLWSSRQSATGSLEFIRQMPATAPMAVLGVRACDLAALAMLDRHFASDAQYQARRSGLLLLAVNCTDPAETCFCHSTGDGPAAAQGYDLLLDELDEAYLLRSGSARGADLLDRLALSEASAAQRAQARQQHETAVGRMHRQLPPDLAGRLVAQPQHAHWDAVAGRCLSCGNCTSVCPTCFCHAERDATDLDGRASRHVREWDSCFSPAHSYIHGKVIRVQTRHRYRQWLTHKLDGWHAQFGRSGCVGCGRCISWCPVGIDLTEELAVICGEAGHG